ncbi:MULTISPECIES: DUF6707 family protein [Pseudomonas]|uniref:Uncharacterized protein n=1 Tax=Pseudomonas gingeri TaxID=117681 RepID=A0A7Y7WSJ0_9PSED|nr:MULTISPECIES: DUF6707 family protein [Pseudomonas]NWB85932.1 hypothetical protein [Pseudomonas gingeri]
MKLTDVLEILSQGDSPVATYLEKIPSKFTKSSKLRLEAFSKLAYVLYVTKEKEQAKFIVDRLAEVPFENNYDYWEWVESALVLKGLLAKESNETSAYDSALASVLEAMNSGSELQVKVKLSVHNRFLEGETLDDEKIRFYADKGDAIAECNERIILLITLLKLKFFDTEASYPVEKIEHEITEQTDRINSLISTVGLFKITPFK